MLALNAETHERPRAFTNRYHGGIIYINERPNQNVYTVIRVSPFCKETREGKFEFEVIA